MTTPVKLYGASKISDYDMWQYARKRLTNMNIEFVNRWMDLRLAAKGGLGKPNAAQSERAWLIDFADVARCDYLLLLAPPENEHLRGGLVEAGYALGQAKPVFLIGEHPDFSTWRYHPMVRQFNTECDRLANIMNACNFVLGIGQ